MILRAAKMKIATNMELDYKYVYFKYIVDGPEILTSNPTTVTSFTSISPSLSLSSIGIRQSEADFDQLPADTEFQFACQDLDSGIGEIDIHVQESDLNEASSALATNFATAAPATRPTDDCLDFNEDDDYDDAQMQTAEADAPQDGLDDEDDDDGSEQELTNLGWLSDLKNMSHWPEIVAGTGVRNRILDDDDDDDIIEPISDKNLTQERFNKFMIQVKQSQSVYADHEDAYRCNANEKPPFNYAQIIAMAMMDRGKMTLKEICQWIQERFAYFRTTDNWNNSIRHNLSLHFCFTKIARDKNEKGKGGYWELSMNTTKSERKRIRNRKKRDSGRIGGIRPMRRSSALTARTRSVTNEDSNELISRTAAAAETLSTTSQIFDEERVLNEEGTIENDLEQQNHLVEQQQQNLLDQQCVEQQIAEHGIIQEQHMIGQFQCITSNELSDFDRTPLINDGSNEIFLGCDIPLSGDCIIIPFNQNSSVASIQPLLTGIRNINQTDESNNDKPTVETINSPLTDQQQQQEQIQQSQPNHQTHQNNHHGPNVIVEPMPYTMSVMDTVVDIEREFSNLVEMPDPELGEVDSFFDYSNW